MSLGLIVSVNSCLSLTPSSHCAKYSTETETLGGGVSVNSSPTPKIEGKTTVQPTREDLPVVLSTCTVNSIFALKFFFELEPFSLVVNQTAQ